MFWCLVNCNHLLSRPGQGLLFFSGSHPWLLESWLYLEAGKKEAFTRVCLNEDWGGRGDSGTKVIVGGSFSLAVLPRYGTNKQ